MTTEQITALAGTLAAVGVPLAFRLASKAGREIRILRNQLEAALRYIYTLRMAMAARGVPKSKIPHAPDELDVADVWSDWSSDDRDEVV